MQSGRGFLKILTSVQKHVLMKARSAFGYSRGEIILLGRTICFAHLETSDSWRCAGQTKNLSEICTARVSMSPLIPKGISGITIFFVSQKTLAFHTGTLQVKQRENPVFFSKGWMGELCPVHCLAGYVNSSKFNIIVIIVFFCIWPISILSPVFCVGRFVWSYNGEMPNLPCMRWFARQGKYGWDRTYLCVKNASSTAGKSFQLSPLSAFINS